MSAGKSGAAPVRPREDYCDYRYPDLARCWLPRERHDEPGAPHRFVSPGGLEPTCQGYLPDRVPSDIDTSS